MDIFDTSVYPFVFISQFVASKSFIIITHETLHKLASEMSFEDDKRNLILIDNTARCGSTLMCQMLSQVPETRVMSEPWVLQHASMVRDNYRGHPWLYNPKNDKEQISEEAFERLLTSITRVLLKFENKHEFKRIVLKVSVTLSNLVPYIKRAMPSFQCIMMTRHVKVSIESFEKMLRGWGPSLTNENHIKKASNLILNWCPFPYDDKKAQEVKQKYIKMNQASNLPIIQVRLLLLGSSMLHFLRHKNIYTHSVVYEDLMKNTKDELKSLFEKVGIPAEFVAYAIKALKFDAQKGTFGKRGTTKLFSETDWEKCDEIFKDIDVPITKDMSIEQLRELMKL